MGQFGFRLRPSAPPGFQRHLIEHVVEGRHPSLRIALQQPVMIGALHPAENFADGSAAGQTHQRTVHTQKPVPFPALHQRRVFGPVDRGQDSRGIEFDEGAGAQFGPGMSQRTPAELGRGAPVGQPAKELLQVGLQRFEAFLEQQEHDHRKGQHTLPREIDRTATMPRAEARIGERVTQLFNERERTSLKRNIVSHPQCTTTLCLHCTFKCTTL